MTEPSQPEPTRERGVVSRRRAWAPWVLAIALVVAGAVLIAIQVAHQNTVQPEGLPRRYADYTPSDDLDSGRLLLTHWLIVGAIAVAAGAVVMTVSFACRARVRPLPAAWRWTPWAVGAAALVGGGVLVAITPRTGSFGWFAYTPLTDSDSGPNGSQSSLSLDFATPRPVTVHLVTGALVLLAGLLVCTVAGVRRLAPTEPAA